ncbi:hypothetical protein Zm00014a_007085 [Zea mays]|uniref:Uncharacterized protein n=1 Tax=Zea mays TaxID=4577 RepID=A0A3L6DZF0_MAIZE|nr:hypothetical protein Zm00014a_007085 [Zea mays]
MEQGGRRGRGETAGGGAMGRSGARAPVMEESRASAAREKAVGDPQGRSSMGKKLSAGKNLGAMELLLASRE